MSEGTPSSARSHPPPGRVLWLRVAATGRDDLSARRDEACGVVEPSKAGTGRAPMVVLTGARSPSTLDMLSAL
eukprot:1234805-Prymnesium_polylepis.2